MFLFKDRFVSASEDTAYPEIRFAQDCVEWALLGAQWHERKFFLWVWTHADSAEAAKLRCRIGVSIAPGNWTIYYTPVYPLTWDRKKVMRDDKCVRICARLISQLLTQKELPHNLREKGYYQFQVSFKVSRKLC
jgi:hypothetical protein